VLQGLWRFYCVKGDLRRGSELAEQLLRLAPRTGDNQLVAVAHLTHGTPFLHRGQFATAQTHMEQAVALYDPAEYRRVIVLTGTDLKSGSLAWSALALWLMGYPDRARSTHAEALAHTDRVGDPFTESYTVALGAWLYQYRREPQPALDFAERLLALSTLRQFGQWIPFALMLRGWALAELGKVDDGIADLRKGLAIFKKTSAELNKPHFMSMLVEALQRAGQEREALAYVEEALELAAKNDDRCWKPELLRLKGVLLLTVDRDADAERYVQRAISTAHGMDARLLELRATVSWCMMQGPRKKKSARTALAKIYGWFSEGFETVDLRDARRLLDELSSTTGAARAPSGKR
jgi:adenylate cyclase